MRALAYGLSALVLLAPFAVAAHPGGLNAEGCHNDRKNGGYHCHRGSSGKKKSAPPRAQGLIGSSREAFPNCSAARAAGRSNIRAGEPGYGPHLDRDGDGVACEN